MSVPPKPRFTPAEYLELERAAAYKSEFYNGEIFAMTSAGEEHNTITFNLAALLAPQLRGTPAPPSELPTDGKITNPPPYRR